MPIIDIQPQALSAPMDTPKGFAVTPGKADVDQGSDAPDMSSWYGQRKPAGMYEIPELGAAFRQDNVATNLLRQIMNPVDNAPDGTNTWESIKGTKYEPHWSSFVDDRSAAAVAARKAKIDQETEDRKLLDGLPWYQSLPAQMVAGVVDLPTLIPGGTFYKGAKGGFAIGKSALSVGAAAGVGAAVQEGALQSMEETRPLSESAVNIGASVLLGGLLGAGTAKFLSKAEWNGAVRAIENELARVDAPPLASVGDELLPSRAGALGAAAVEPSDLAGNTVAGRAAGLVANVSAPINPALRFLTSPSSAVREIATGLFENSVYLKKNMDGFASEPAVETLMKEWNGGLAKSVQATAEAYSSYRKAGGQLSRTEFQEEVGRAMRRGDTSDIPEVDKVAKAWRAQVFDPLKEAAIKANLLPADVTVETAASYFSRMWNRNKLIAREGSFKQIVTDWIERETPKWRAIFDRETAEGAAKLKDDKLKEYLLERRLEREARFEDTRGSSRDIANEVFDKLTGKAIDGSMRPEFLTVQARGPLKERTFNIPDALVEEFLESNVDLVGRRYARVMGADVELANKFGSVDMAEQIAKIREDYKALRAEVSGDEKAAAKLDAREKADIRDLETVRDLLRGTRQESPLERNYGKIARIANHINYMRSMGEVVLASLMDAVRPAMVNGLGQYLADLPKVMTAGGKAAIAEAQLAGNIAERVLAHRLATITEIIDPYTSRGPIEKFFEGATNIASQWNGIRIWTDMMKSVASVMTQNRVLKNIEGFGSIKGSEKAYMAYLGIDESMAGRIAVQMGKHGETLDGVRVAHTQDWTDPQAVRAFRAAINKDVDSIIVQKSVADVPLFANTPTGRMLLQFKSFALASHQKVLLRGLQEDQSRFVGGLIGMTAMGMFVTWAKAVTGNRTEKLQDITTNPGWWIGEGLDRSGILAVPMEFANAFEKIAGANPIKGPFKLGDEKNQLSQKNQNRNELGSLLGPSFGTVSDAISVANIPKKLYDGEDVTQGQKNAATRMLPFSSFAGVRQLMNYVVNPPQ